MHITLQIKDFVKPRLPQTIPPMRIVIIVHPEMISFVCFAIVKLILRSKSDIFFE